MKKRYGKEKRNVENERKRETENGSKKRNEKMKKGKGRKLGKNERQRRPGKEKIIGKTIMMAEITKEKSRKPK